MTRDLLRDLERLLRPIKVRIANSIARAVVQIVDEDKKLQILQVGAHDGEDIDDAERFQEYGFSSVPKPGAEAVIVFPNGDRAHALVVAVDDRRYRPTGWQPGEVGMYTDEGALVRLKRGQVTVLVATEVRLGADDATDPVALKSDLVALKNAISSAVPAPNDGGAALKAGIMSALGSWPTCATKVTAK
jgi:phage baseplate assembly protein V